MLAQLNVRNYTEKKHGRSHLASPKPSKLTKNYTQSANDTLDLPISDSAYRLHMRMLQKPKDWIFYAENLFKEIKCGNQKGWQLLKELEKSDLLIRVRHIDETGRMAGVQFLRFHTQEEGQAYKARHQKNFPYTENQRKDNQPPIKETVDKDTRGSSRRSSPKKETKEKWDGQTPAAQAAEEATPKNSRPDIKPLSDMEKDQCRKERKPKLMADLMADFGDLDAHDLSCHIDDYIAYALLKGAYPNYGGCKSYLTGKVVQAFRNEANSELSWQLHEANMQKKAHLLTLKEETNDKLASAVIYQMKQNNAAEYGYFDQPIDDVINF